MINLSKKYINLEPYDALFPKDSKNYPSKQVVSYLYIEKQCNNKIWGENYWKLESSTEEYNKEYFTGFIKNNNNIVLVEDNPKPNEGSTGVFELEYIGKNKYNVYYLGIGEGITFTTIGNVKNCNCN